MHTPLVSILTTIYNREKYIAQCIDSVLESTFQDWEMIIVDDCSTDNSVAIARDYEKQDNRIIVYVNEQNIGDYPNRNKAASYATGKYLKYLDADDIIYPHGLEVMVKAMEQYPEAAFGSQHVVRECAVPYPFMIGSRDAFTEHFFGKSYFQSGPTGTIFKREEFFKLGTFTGRRYIGDTEMWIKFALHAPIVLFQPSLIWWRQHPGQEFQLGQTNDGYRIMNFNLHLETLENNQVPLTIEEKKLAIKKLKYSTLKLFLAELIKRRNLKTAFFVLKKMVRPLFQYKF